MNRVLLIALAGALGALARVGLSSVVQRHAGMYPWGTFAVNMIGCFLFGVVWSLAETRMVISHETRAILLAGFLGAFTTFSSFAYENAQLWQHGRWTLLSVNLIAQNALGVALVLGGMAVGRAS